jgi:hypothetical protein
MKNKPIFTPWLVGMLTVSIIGLLLSTNIITQKAQGAEPILNEPYVYEDYDEYYGGWAVIFEVFYQDLDNDEGDVILFIKGQEYTMNTDLNIDPFIFMQKIRMVISHTLVAM